MRRTTGRRSVCISELVKRYSTVAACATYRKPLDMLISMGLDKVWITQTCGKGKSIDSAPLLEISVRSAVVGYLNTSLRYRYWMLHIYNVLFSGKKFSLEKDSGAHQVTPTGYIILVMSQRRFSSTSVLPLSARCWFDISGIMIGY